MMFTPEGGIKPLLAESYDHPDALTYIYKIKQGIKFHDGTEMTMDDVLASIDRVRDPNIASSMAWMYDPVGKVEAQDKQTLKIRSEPRPPWTMRLTLTSCAPCSQVITSLASLDQPIQSSTNSHSKRDLDDTVDCIRSVTNRHSDIFHPVPRKYDPMGSHLSRLLRKETTAPCRYNSSAEREQLSFL